MLGSKSGATTTGSRTMAESFHLAGCQVPHMQSMAGEPEGTWPLEECYRPSQGTQWALHEDLPKEPLCGRGSVLIDACASCLYCKETAPSFQVKERSRCRVGRQGNLLCQ